MFQSFTKEPHWRDKPLPNHVLPYMMMPNKARKAGKSSKVALLAIVKASQTAKIRFILNGINLEDVVTKNKAPHHFGGSITAGELRFVYRHWQSDFKDRVVFYLNDQKVPAPWDSDPDLWAQYQPQNTYQ